MKNNREFYRCGVCGNVVTLLNNGGGTLVCCGEDMKLLEPNTQDGAKEKHVPAVTREDGVFRVVIGETEHPMTREHHITWIAAAQGETTSFAWLDVNEAPRAAFKAEEGPATVYAYCNLHGLWAAEVN